ncbi:MAG: Lrp/AsnC family transcriptional regulator [Actinobacteria bacterium]|nr:Lrp/AsnC family transcriptional regulator [Actinomycetota bacterium]
MRLDDLDRKIIAQLLDDGRRSFRALGTTVGLSAPAVKRRVDRLRAAGVIDRFTVTVDPRVMGWSVEAFIELFCAPRTPALRIREALTGHPEIVSAFTITGDADALLHLRVADAAHLEEALERIRAERIVTQTRSVVVLSRLLDRT